jgi:uncharacterized protein HemX
MQQPRGYVGYPGGNLAVEIYTHNRQDIRLNAKANKAAKKSSNTGLYLGSAAAMGVLALGAYAYNKKGQKTVQNDLNLSADPAESFAFQC